MTLILVNTGWGNGLLADGTNPLPEPMLTSHSQVLWHSHESNFTARAQAPNRYNEFKNYIFKITVTSPQGQWINYWTCIVRKQDIKSKIVKLLITKQPLKQIWWRAYTVQISKKWSIFSCQNHMSCGMFSLIPKSDSYPAFFLCCVLTHCGPMKPWDITEPGQYWFSSNALWTVWCQVMTST